MILNFADKDTKSLFEGRSPKKFGASLRRKLLDKIQILHYAHRLQDLRVPPGNRLEALSGNRRGQYSIRVNDQWRVCFRWDGENARDVEIVDYH